MVLGPVPVPRGRDLRPIRCAAEHPEHAGGAGLQGAGGAADGALPGPAAAGAPAGGQPEAGAGPGRLGRAVPQGRRPDGHPPEAAVPGHPGGGLRAADAPDAPEPGGARAVRAPDAGRPAAAHHGEQHDQLRRGRRQEGPAARLPRAALPCAAQHRDAPGAGRHPADREPRRAAGGLRLQAGPRLGPGRGAQVRRGREAAAHGGLPRTDDHLAGLQHGRRRQ